MPGFRNIPKLRGGGSSGRPSWMPPVYQGLAYYWDPGFGITIATGVSSWVDRISGVAMTQGSAAVQPTFTAADANYANKPSLTFSGAQYMTTSSNLTKFGNFVTTFIVFRQSVASGNECLFELGPDYATTAGTYIHYLNVSTQRVAANVGTGVSEISGATGTTATTYKDAFVIDGTQTGVAQLSLYRGGSLQTPTTVSALSTAGSISATRALAIGGRTAGTLLFQGSVAAALVYTSALSAGNIQTLTNWANGRFG